MPIRDDELHRPTPAQTPSWTDSRDGDPGRTLAELLAFLADGIGSAARGRGRIAAALAIGGVVAAVALRRGRRWKVP